jgi:hypothetical protein
MESSVGEIISGSNKKTFKDFLQKGKEWVEQKELEGWRYTCMGWLSPKDIEEAGLIFDNNLEYVWDNKEGKMVDKAIGYMRIPIDTYYVENSKIGTIGAKYYGPSKKFMEWYTKRYKSEEYQDPNEKHINKEIKKKEWEADDIDF